MNIIPEITAGQILMIILPLFTGALGIWGTYLVFKTKSTLKLVEFDKRVSDLSAGLVSTTDKLNTFMTYADKQFVTGSDIAHLQASIDKSIDRMQVTMDLAAATMGDVRDQVITLTARAGKSTVPPARRRLPKAVA